MNRFNLACLVCVLLGVCSTLMAAEESSLQKTAEGSLQDPAEGSLQDPAEGSLQDPAEGSLQDSAEGSVQDPAEGSLQKISQQALGEEAKKAQKEKDEADRVELEELDSFSTQSEEGEEMICDPEALLASGVEGGLELTLYDCKSLQTKAAEPTTDERGRGEAEMLKREILEDQGKADKNVVIVIKDDADVYKEDLAPTPFAVEGTSSSKRHAQIKYYVSFRGHLNSSEFNQELLNDGTSRAGILYFQELESGLELTLHAEAGLQLVDDVDVSDRLKSTSRLLYGSVGMEGLSLSYGKNWSVYYNVANVTDRFLVYGGRAAGVYNADTDGGASGTGRADNALQLRSARKKFEWGLQLQHNEKIPRISENIKYDWNSSLSGLYRWENGITSGVAYNVARPEGITTAMQAQGITGDAKARIISANYLADDNYIGVTLSRTENHDTDNKHTYLDTKGWEIYYRHDLNLKWRLIAGHNRLNPTSNNYQGEFDVKETIIGTQFTFGELDFTDMVFVEAAYRQGHLADGSSRESQITVGFRYRFSY